MPRPEEKLPALRSPAPQHDPVFIWPTPSNADYLFWVEKNGDLPKNKTFEYGDPYTGSNAGSYPDHTLVYVAPQSADKWSKWYYASSRINQDDYNWEISQGQELIRTYLIKRDLYFARTTAGVTDEFICPEVPTADVRFEQYGFADDTVSDAPEELRSLFVIIRRRFIEPTTTEYRFDDTFQKYVQITKQIIPTGSFSPPPPAAGTSVEVQHGNSFHDVEITQTLVGLGSGYELPAIPTTFDRQFPGKLVSVELVYAWAYAASTGFARSYSEDYYFKFKINKARPGPYSASERRFITGDPAATKAAYPITIVPQPVSETIGVVGAWFFASSEVGNSTFAIAKEWAVPATIHDTISVNFNGAVTTPDVTRPASSSHTSTLAATPGASTFLLRTSAIMDYQVRQLPYGLYEVRVVEVDISNLYG